jgi:hypothetical protein
MTIDPIHSPHSSQVNQTKTPAIPKQEARKATYPQDTVSLKNPAAVRDRGNK